MNRLVVERSKDKELVAIVELGDDHCSRCFADGIQTVTGCTFGKGNLRKKEYGKFGVTLVDRPAETFASFVCDLYGETVVEKYGRIIGGRKVCIPCQEEGLMGE